MSDRARLCPSGQCALDGARLGTCELMRDRGGWGRGEWRFCRGWFATVCRESFEAWKAAGSPLLSDAEVRAAMADAPREPVPALPAPTRACPPEVRSAPASLDAWTLYAPHAPNADRAGTWHDENQRKVLHAAGRYAQWIADGRALPSWCLLGYQGTGKTLLARILARLAWEARYAVGFFPWQLLVEEVKESRSAGDRRPLLNVLGPVIGFDLVVLDDVRPLYRSQDDENIAHAVITGRDRRNVGGLERPTIITANLSRSELVDVLGPGAVGRLLEPGRHPSVFDWPSYRAREVPA